MTYGLYIGISALPIQTASTKEELRAQVAFLDPADLLQGWTIAPVSLREPWPRYIEGRRLNPVWLAIGAALLVFSLFVGCNLLRP